MLPSAPQSQPQEAVSVCPYFSPAALSYNRTEPKLKWRSKNQHLRPHRSHVAILSSIPPTLPKQQFIMYLRVCYTTKCSVDMVGDRLLDTGMVVLPREF